MNKKQNEIIALVKLMFDIVTRQERLTEKRIKTFNFLNNYVLILNKKYIRAGKVKKSIKILDKDNILIRLRKSKYGYYKIHMKIRDIEDMDIRFLVGILEYLNNMK